MTVSFTPHSVFWRVNSDALVNLAGSRALLLELAHPLVAAGVAGHSNYRGDPFGRLMRTLSTMSRLMFTDAGSAEAALRHFNACHARVKGALDQAVGPRSSRLRAPASSSVMIGSVVTRGDRRSR